MLKKNIFIKKFNKTLLSIIGRIESFFNYFKDFYKKNKIKIGQRILLVAGSIIFLLLSYFLIPSFYDKKIVKIELENQILQQYNLEVKLGKLLKYSLFPKPHFYIKDANIIYKDDNLAKSNLTKVYISKNFSFSPKNIKIKDVKFRQTEFIITNNNLDFFKKLLNFNKSNYNLNFSNSKLFYKDQNDDVIFFTKIKHLDFFINENFEYVSNSKLQIFNTLFKLNIINNLKDKKSLIRINSHKLRLNIDNKIDYSDQDFAGLLNLRFINKSKKIDYIKSKNFLKFNTDDKIFKGLIDLKPFYLTSSLKINEINIGKIFKDDSILLNLLNSEILNNQNLNANINLYSNRIKGINYLNNINLKIFFEEGNILIKDSKINWRNSISIDLENIQFVNDENKIFLDGGVVFNFINVKDFYKQYQIKKINRKYVKRIKVNFIFDFNEKKFEIKNITIDGSSKKNSDDFIVNFNAKKQNILNKIVFKNIIKEFFENF